MTNEDKTILHLEKSASRLVDVLATFPLHISLRLLSMQDLYGESMLHSAVKNNTALVQVLIEFLCEKVGNKGRRMITDEQVF